MLDEFRDISSAREIPMFKGDQWELTVPALMQEVSSKHNFYQ